MHFPKKHDKQLTCYECSFQKNYRTKKNKSNMLYHCNSCNINLFISCFKLFHERVFN